MKFDRRKFAVLRPDGSRPDWPFFVLNLNDEGAYIALTAYTNHYVKLGDADPAFIAFLYEVLADAEEYAEAQGWHRPDQPSGRDEVPVVEHEVVTALLDGAKDITAAMVEGLPHLVQRVQRARTWRSLRRLTHLLLT